MATILDGALLADLTAAGQGHLAAHAGRLKGDERTAFTAELRRLDWTEVGQLVDLIQATDGSARSPELAPAPTIKKGADARVDAEAAARGRALLAAGQVAAFVVAGGQGSRLGFEGPKGLYPATPIRGTKLFEVFARKILALGRRYGVSVPWYVMTSATNHEATQEAFKADDWYGLSPGDVAFFQQDMLPAMGVDGRVLLADRASLFLSPNGHGGSLLALARSGALEAMRSRGIEQIFYFQVDNPLVEMADPIFLGHHEAAAADMSSKVVAKREAGEKVGVVGLVDGHYGVIEYSDLSADQREATLEDGRLRFRDGNIATHFIRRDFVERVTRGGLQLPYHLARKSIPAYDPESGSVRLVDGVKFETFVFDALGLARESVVLEVDRAAEFAPIKNASGADSPADSCAAQSRLFADWLAGAGLVVPRDAAGAPLHPIDIDPSFADSAAALAERVRDGAVVDCSGPLVLGY